MFTALALAAAAGIAAQAHGSRGETAGSLREDSLRSASLARRLPFRVYLPPGYDSGSGRYPVVYFLHGLPAPPTAYRSIGFVVRGLERAGRPALIVAPRGADSDDSDPEYLDRGPGRNWETALASELPAYVDSHYRTIASRRGRALVGVSAGGYGAVLLALHHLGSFAAVESWSGYFHPTDPTGTRSLDLGSAAANVRASAHRLVPGLRARFRARPTLLAFYVGDADERFRAENVALARELRRAGVPFVFRVYPGAHSQAFWSAHAGDWLALAIDRLEPAG